MYRNSRLEIQKNSKETESIGKTGAGENGLHTAKIEKQRFKFISINMKVSFMRNSIHPCLSSVTVPIKDCCSVIL